MVFVLDNGIKKTAVAILAVAATLGVATLVSSHSRADHYSHQGTQEGLERALAIQPENAEFHNRLGRVLLFSPLGNTNRAKSELRRAVALDPRTGSYWVDLALARELENDLAGAAQDLDAARKAEPRTPAVIWHQANFQLRRGENAQALESLRELLQEAPDYTSKALPLFAHVADPRVLVEKAIPLRSDAVAASLEFLRRQNQVGAAQATWEHALRLEGSLPAADVRYFVDWLIASGEAQLAQRVWTDAARKGWIPIDAASSDQPLYNADFQFPLQDFGFDWRVRPHAEASVWIEARGPEPGKQSLCVQFSDGARSEYGHVVHYIPVQPGTHYALRGRMRSERLFSRVGAFLAVREMVPGRPVVNTEPVVGTSNWKEVALQVETGPETRMVQLMLSRPGTLKGEQPASGLVCMAALKWESLGPAIRPVEGMRTKP